MLYLLFELVYFYFQLAPFLSSSLLEFFLLLCSTFFDVKSDVLMCITEPSNDDYDNDVIDNCGFNFGTFGVKNYQKVYT